ncbi:hypothetical protein U3516DRAFT_660594 [Neocallimastix sp. 'constans']
MNNIDPKDYCFDGSTVNFETNKNKFSEWYIEGMICYAYVVALIHILKLKVLMDKVHGELKTVNGVNIPQNICWSLVHDYPYCSNQNIKAEMVDNLGPKSNNTSCLKNQC